jgi:hypothetical protein
MLSTNALFTSQATDITVLQYSDAEPFMEMSCNGGSNGLNSFSHSIAER